MSNFLLAVLVLLVGVVTYGLLQALVTPVRIAGACFLVVFLAALVVVEQNRERIRRQTSSSDISGSANLSENLTLNVSDPTPDARPVAYVTLESFSKEDRDFLDKIFQKEYQDRQQLGKPSVARVQNIRRAGIVGSDEEPVLRAELVINTAEGKPSEPFMHHETFKRAELARSRHR